jgi:hypothetical protein
MKNFETIADLKAAVDAVFGMESEVLPDHPFSDISLRYHSPTGVELLRLRVPEWDRWHVSGFGHFYPPIEKALKEVGKEVAP